MDTKIYLYCVTAIGFLGAYVYASTAEVLCNKPSQLQETSAAATEEVLAEGMITVELQKPVLTGLTAASEPPVFTYRLIYRNSELIDGQSWSYYQKIWNLEAVSENTTDAVWMRQQLALTLDKKGMPQIAAFLDDHSQELELLEQAVRCRTVWWPRINSPRETVYSGIRGMPGMPGMPMTPGMLDFPENESPSDDTSSEPSILAIRDIPQLFERLESVSLLLALKTRYHITGGDYKEACRWLRIGLAQARQMAMNADAPLAMAGVAAAGRMLGQIEWWIQQPNAPSLFRSLTDLPRPLIAFSNINGMQIYKEVGSFDVLEVMPEIISQSPFMIRGIERWLAAIQCVEAVRLHAAINEGLFPASLDEITDVRVPLDPVMRRPFGYTLQDGNISLSSEETNADQRIEFHYRITTTQPMRYMPGF